MSKCTIACPYNTNGDCHFYNTCIIRNEVEPKLPSAQLTVLPPQTMYDAAQKEKDTEFTVNFNPFQRGNGCLLDEHTR